jgi:hypothetical protein
MAISLPQVFSWLQAIVRDPGIAIREELAPQRLDQAAISLGGVRFRETPCTHLIPAIEPERNIGGGHGVGAGGPATEVAPACGVDAEWRSEVVPVTNPGAAHAIADLREVLAIRTGWKSHWQIPTVGLANGTRVALRSLNQLLSTLWRGGEVFRATPQILASLEEDRRRLSDFQLGQKWAQAPWVTKTIHSWKANWMDIAPENYPRLEPGESYFTPQQLDRIDLEAMRAENWARILDLALTSGNAKDRQWRQVRHAPALRFVALSACLTYPSSCGRSLAFDREELVQAMLRPPTTLPKSEPISLGDHQQFWETVIAAHAPEIWFNYWRSLPPATRTQTLATLSSDERQALRLSILIRSDNLEDLLSLESIDSPLKP